MARYTRRRKFCKFTAEGIEHIDYKDIDLLQQFISETGKIIPSRITGDNWRVLSKRRGFWHFCPIRTATKALKLASSKGYFGVPESPASPGSGSLALR